MEVKMNIEQKKLERILEIPTRVRAHSVHSEGYSDAALEIPDYYEGKITPDMIDTPGFSGVEGVLEHLRDNFEKSIKANEVAFASGSDEVRVRWITNDEEYVYKKVGDITTVNGPFSNPETRRLLDYILIKNSCKNWRIDYGEGNFGRDPAQRFIKYPEILR